MINTGKIVNEKHPEVSLEYELTSEDTLLYIGILPGPLVSSSILNKTIFMNIITASIIVISKEMNISNFEVVVVIKRL